VKRAEVSVLAAPRGPSPALAGLWGRMRRAGGLRRPEVIWGYLFILPNFVGFICFTFGPIVASFGLMFTDWTVIRTPSFVGLENFERLLADDVFWVALSNTVLYVVLYVPTVTVSAFFLALLMDRKLRGIGLYRTIFFMPSVCMFVAVALVWQFLYQPSTGVFTYYLSLIGIVSPNWLSDPHWAMVAIAIMGVWRHVGYFALIFLAGLQSVPNDLHEAAAVDGANAWVRVRRITVPLIYPTTFFVLVMAFIEAFQLFGEPYVMTKGGPGYATTTLVYLIYRNAFEGFKMGYAATQSWVLFAIIFAVTFVQWRMNSERNHGFDR
jgi:multiple sugar transport system permease protein